MSFIVAGPLVGYSLAFRRVKLRRWHVILYSTVGGAVSGALLGVLLILATPSWAPTDPDWLQNLLLYAGMYAIFGFLIGLGGILMRAARARWGRRALGPEP